MLPLCVWGEVYDLHASSILSIHDKPFYHQGRISGKDFNSESVSPSQFVGSLAAASYVDRVNGGGYWFYQKIKNSSEIERWVIDPSGSIIDTVKVYLYRKHDVETYTSGYLHDFNYPLSYGVSVNLAPEEEVEILVFIESRYYTYNPSIEIKPFDSFMSSSIFKGFLIMGCFGGILILACYNLFLGVWIRDRSNLYYSGYLVLSVVSWLAAFNVLSEWFSWKSYWLLISPFFLTLSFNTLYVIHFLELPKNKPAFARISYGFVVFTVAISLAMPLFSMGVYMLLYGLTTTVWIIGALVFGVNRLISGYKPARFFVLAFAVLAVGIVLSSMPIFIPSIKPENNYLLTLVTQTIDMLLLSLALADRINVLRSDKEQALEKALETEVWAIEKEREANLTLQQSLDIAEQENQRKSDFLRMVSHELRTPLYSIISSVDRWNDTDDEKVHKDLLEYMSYGAARLRMQVDNLVLLAETDNKTLEQAFSPFEVRSMLEAVCENIQGLLNPSVEFDFKSSDSVPVACNGDSYLIQHMLRTVLENACKYTEHGKIGFYVQWDDNTLVFKIVDSGCGMTREQERTMFNDFVQVSRGLERNSEGLGIGLTVCYRLSEVLGADLNIQSTLGEGTDVSIALPIDALNRSIGGPHPERIEKAEVLIVEDNIVNAQIIESLVEMMGAVATVVESGQEALSLLDERSFDLILMDIQMPVMDGITATRWIRRRNHFMPIVAVTANSDVEVRKRCMEVGMNDFLVKPIRRSDLQRVMERQLLAKKPY
ncbi:MAG: signal transduction histidine kinase [Pseudohongiellaceae bacterium]|jgi:signal transduction histidine kinase